MCFATFELLATFSTLPPQSVVVLQPMLQGVKHNSTCVSNKRSFRQAYLAVITVVRWVLFTCVTHSEVETRLLMKLCHTHIVYHNHTSLFTHPHVFFLFSIGWVGYCFFFFKNAEASCMFITLPLGCVLCAHLLHFPHQGWKSKPLEIWPLLLVL